MGILEEKAELRRTMELRLARIPAPQRQRAAASIARTLPPLLLDARRVALFAGLPDRLNTDPLDAALRALEVERVYPRVCGLELVFHVAPTNRRPSAFARDASGTPSPDSSWPVVPLASCDYVLVPGLAFDLEGGRLGRGSGCYDRALAAVNTAERFPRVIGLGFDEQIVPRVPCTDHDIRLDHIVTSSRHAALP